MATRSRIALKLNETECLSIYCHWDGYISNQGPILVKHYTTEEKVRTLMELGDLSFLGEELGEKHDFDRGHNEHPRWCLAYGRDRGEDNTQARQDRIDSLLGNGIEYVYLFDPSACSWSVSCDDHVPFQPLAEHPDLWKGQTGSPTEGE